MNTFRPWSEIYPDGTEFKTHILEIQKFATPREKSLKWAQNLRFLTAFQQANPDRDADWSDDEGLSCDRCCDYPYFNSPDSQHPTVTALRLTQSGEVKDCAHYLAVSYCWRQPKSQSTEISDATDAGSYTVYTKVTSTAKESRPSKAPKKVLDRAIAYASFYGIRFIWIDQECIEQDDRLDQEVGIQSMDLVYERSAAPVGILQTFFDSQWQLDMLWHLHENKELDHDEVKRAVQLLEQISGDPWFSRAWILQESTSAGDCIDLLLRYDSSLSVPELWEDIPGEIELQFDDLLRFYQAAVEQLCRRHFGLTAQNATQYMDTILDKLAEHENDVDKVVASIDENEGLMTRLEKVVERVLLHTPWDYYNARIRTHRPACNASLASFHLRQSFNSKPMDRLAILANMCLYPIRIDTTMVQGSKYPLETCLFVQAVLNGDLSFLIALKKEVWHDLASDREGFSWLPPSTTNLDPNQLEALMESFRPFRLSNHQISSEGLSLLGFLWTVYGVVDVTDLQAKFAPLFQELSQSASKEWTEVENDMQQWPEIKDSGLLVPKLSSMENKVNPTKDLNRWKDEMLYEKLCTQIVWLILQKLVDQRLIMLADAIWQFFRVKFRLFTSLEWESIKKRYNAQEDRPATVDEWIEENIDLEARALPASCVHALQLHDDIELLMKVRTTHLFSGRDGHPVKQINPWFIDRVLEKGYFHYGHLADQDRDGPLAVFDVDKPTKILLPYSEGMGEFGIQWNGNLSIMEKQRIAWVVEEVDKGDLEDMKKGKDDFRSFASHGMVAGMWKLGDTKPKRYNLC